MMGHPTQSIKHAQVVAVCTNSFSDAPRPLWVNFCRAISRNVRLLYPIKLPRRPFAIEAVKGHKPPLALQELGGILTGNSAVGRRDTAVGGS
jgi:hypothetical protein